MVPSEFFAQQTNAAGVDTVVKSTIGFSRNRMAQPTCLSELVHQGSALCVHIRFISVVWMDVS
jgi:hypothetical protein